MYVANGKEMNDMMTVAEKNARARELVESLESPAMTRDLLNALEGDPDLRMKSMVCYHLMRRILDAGSFRPEQTLEIAVCAYVSSVQQRDLLICRIP